MKILLIEDEPNVAAFIKQGLEEQIYSVDVAYDGEMGLRLFSQNQYNLILLDVIIPYINGFDLCKRIKTNDTTICILMLSALSTTTDIVNGLDSGADDYLVKPFKLQELLARIRALTRRKTGEVGNKLKIADLELDVNTKTVTRNKKLIKLTSREYRLLHYLLQNKGMLVSRADIAENIWEQSFESGSNVIDVYINYLRKKIDKDSDVKLIHTIVGMRYMLKESD